MAKISDKLRDRSSSSSGSDAIKAKIYCCFRHEKPVHSVLGGGKRDVAGMRTQPSKMTATSFNVMVLAVTVGVICSGGFALLLGFVGLLIGASLIAIHVRTVDDMVAPMGLAVITGVGRLMAFLRRNIAVVGVALASSAVTAVASEESPQICFSFFALFLLGMCLIVIGLHGE